MGFAKTNPRAAGTESLTHLCQPARGDAATGKNEPNAGHGDAFLGIGFIHRRRLLPAQSAEWPLWVGLLVLLVGLILPNSIGVGRATLWKLRSY